MTKPDSSWRSTLPKLLSLWLAAACTVRSAAGQVAPAAVFASPSPEMVDVSHSLGIPFGGIGTGFSVFGKYGFVDVYFDGHHLDSNDWKVDQPPQQPPSFAFQLTEGDKSMVLQETPVAWLPNAQPAEQVQAFADLPKGHFVFTKAGSNLGLVMTGFSPLVPHDLANPRSRCRCSISRLKTRGTKLARLDWRCSIAMHWW